MTITQNVLLQQVCGGFVKDSEGSVHRVGEAKRRKLKVLMKKYKRPLVVFCKYKEEIQQVREVAQELDYRIGLIRGGRKNKKLRAQILRKFQEGRYDVIICQIRTGGVGVDLFVADHAIFYSLTYSYIDYEQAASRLDCIGKKTVPTLHFIFAQNTIDEDIYQTILSKRSVSRRILTRLRKRRLKRWQKQ
jgi:SNF2 family DNA or RNA helicase